MHISLSILSFYGLRDFNPRYSLLLLQVLLFSSSSATVDNTIEQLEGPSPHTRRSNAIKVRLTGTRGGLGITVVGGRNVRSSDNNFGVYIKEVVQGQLADKNGK